MSGSNNISETKLEKKQPFGKMIKFYAGNSCRYEVVRSCAAAMGWQLVTDPSQRKQCNIFWIDTSNVGEFLGDIKPWQRINHFPGMINISRKNRLAQNLEAMKKEFPQDYGFFLKTYVLPSENRAFRENFGATGTSRKIFIMKPESGSQGRGIFLTRTVENIDPGANLVAQEYIQRPLLIDGKKFDLRIYVLMTSCKPLRLYLFQDGLVRMCTENFTRPNSSNMDNKYMHLTNYSINKSSEKYDRGEGPLGTIGTGGSKRSLKWFLEWLREREGSQAVSILWKEVSGICVKTVLSILPVLVSEYNMKFKLSQGFKVESDEPEEDEKENTYANTSKENENIEEANFFSEKNPDLVLKELRNTIGVADDPQPSSKIDENKLSNISQKNDTSNNGDMTVLGSRCSQILGIDVLIDENLKPFLLEVNALPSYATGAPVDCNVKTRLVSQALATFQSHPEDQQKYEIEKKKRSKFRLTKRLKMKESSSDQTSLIMNSSQPALQERLVEHNMPKPSKKDSSTEKGKLILSCPDSKFKDDDVAREKAQEKIHEIYKIHALNKIDKVNDLINKYPVEEKYCKKSTECSTNQVLLEKKRDKRVSYESSATSVSSCADNSEFHKNYVCISNQELVTEHSDSEEKEGCFCPQNRDTAEESHEEEIHLKDFDKIYPQSSCPDYNRMKSYAFEEFLKKIDRLICPLYMNRCLDIDGTNGQYHYKSRGDCWIKGDMFLPKSCPSFHKIPVEPNPHQVEVAERLSKGLSAHSEESETSFVLSNGSEQLSQRVLQAMEDAKIFRKRIEKKFAKKCFEPIPIKQLELFGIDSCGTDSQLKVIKKKNHR